VLIDGDRPRGLSIALQAERGGGVVVDGGEGGVRGVEVVKAEHRDAVEPLELVDAGGLGGAVV